MRRLVFVVIGLMMLSPVTAVAQTATPAATQPEVPTQAPTQPPTQQPPAATEEPGVPVAPVDTGEDDDDGGLSPTAIAVIIILAVVVLLAIWALAWGPWRRPGEPGPP